MDNFSELLTGLTGVLESQASMQITNNWPATPTAIFYVGAKAYEAQSEIMATLQRVWRGRAEDVCQMVVHNGEYYALSDSDTWQALSPAEVQEQIDGMFAQQRSFRTMNGLLLVTILNTTAYAELEQFRKDYAVLDELKAQLGMSACNMMKIVLLDESGKAHALSRQIRTYLRESIRTDESSSKATIILSNRLKNGVLLAGGRIRENYALAGNLIILANNSNNQSKGAFKPQYSRMFSPSAPRFITASYTHDSKPNKAICEVLLNAALSWLKARFSEGDLLTADMLSKRLEITGGSIKSVDRFFQQNIAGRLPPREVLEYLPRTGVNLDRIGTLSFKEYDRITMGGFRSFYKGTVLPICASEDVKREFRDYFRNQVQGQFAPKEAARSITIQTIDRVLNQFLLEEASEARPAADYMLAKAKADYAKAVLPVCREVLSEIGTKARLHITQITEISEEFQHSYMLDIDDTVQQYYHGIAIDKLNSGLGEQLMAAFNKPDLTKAEMLKALEQVIHLIFASHKIFGLPLQEEMTMRMGGNADQVQKIVQQELTDGLGDSIRLQTAIVPELIFEMILVNKYDASGNDGLFYNYLSNSFNNAECLNTGNSNAVEFVQLYAIDTDTL